MRKIITALVAAALIFSVASCGGKKAEPAPVAEAPKAVEKAEVKQPAKAADDYSNVKIGFILLHDPASSTYDNNFYLAALEVQKKLGLSNDQVIFKWNIEEGSVCYDTACDMADSGCNIVFADSFGHETYMIQAAKEYPDVQFCHATGTKSRSEGVANFHNAFASIYEGRYLSGIAAGMKINEMIESGKITPDKAKLGYVAAFPYAEVISGYTSFFLGARSVCPTATMEVTYTNSWFDIAKEKTGAEALIKNGCIFISQHADSEGAPKACAENGVPNVSYNVDTTHLGPDTALISSRINWAPYFEMIIKATAKGESFVTDYIGTMATGSVELTKLNEKVAAKGTQEALDKAISDLKAGKIKVFSTDSFTYKGEKLTEYLADVVDKGDFKPETNVIINGEFVESGEQFRSAPYFDIMIDGIKKYE